MSNVRIVDYAVTLAGIFALPASTKVLATEDPNSVVQEHGDRLVSLENPTRDDGVPADSAQGRTLDLMLMIWTLKTTSSDTE